MATANNTELFEEFAAYDLSEAYGTITDTRWGSIDHEDNRDGTVNLRIEGEIARSAMIVNHPEMGQYEHNTNAVHPVQRTTLSHSHTGYRYESVPFTVAVKFIARSYKATEAAFRHVEK